mgnify:FL=1
MVSVFNNLYDQLIIFYIYLNLYVKILLFSHIYSYFLLNNLYNPKMTIGLYQLYNFNSNFYNYILMYMYKFYH